MTSPVDFTIADLSYKEQPPGSNLTKYGDRFFPGQPSPWCAEMISCTTKDAGAHGPWSASVGLYRNQARAEGRIVDLPAALDAIHAGTHVVSVGFEWEHDTWPDHIGWLLDLGAGVGTIHTIEGNSPGPDHTDEIAYHQRPTTAVSFYCLVELESGSAQPAKPVNVPVSPVYPGRPVLGPTMTLAWKPNKVPGRTNHGDKVAVLQAFFHALGGGWDPGPVDGVIGPRTNDIIGRFQQSSHLQVDHVVGQQTWRAAFGA